MTIASYKFSEEISYSAHEYCFFLILNLKKMLFLIVLVMTHTRFRVNPHSMVTWMSRNSLLEAETWRLSDCNWTWTQNHLVVNWTLNHLAKLEKKMLFLSNHIYTWDLKEALGNLWAKSSLNAVIYIMRKRQSHQ